MSCNLRQAALLHPTFPSLVLFFSGNQYVIVDAQTENRNPTIQFGPRFIAQDWPSLIKAGFDKGIDAILPNPKDRNTAYFFSDGKYILATVAPPGGPQLSNLLDGPNPLSQWKSLNTIGFTTVDAVLSLSTKYAYVFNGDSYNYIEVDPTVDALNAPGKIARHWSSLTTLGFTENLGVVFPVGNTPTEAYFFKDDKYSLVGGIVVGTHCLSFLPDV